MPVARSPFDVSADGRLLLLERTISKGVPLADRQELDRRPAIIEMCLVSSGLNRQLPMTKPRCSTSCARPSTRGSTRSATSISITPAASLYAESQVREHADAAERAASSATRTRPARPRRRRRRWSSRRARRGARLVQRRRATTSAVFTQNATAALKLVGESYPFAPAAGCCSTVRQPQLGQRHPRVRARAGAPPSSTRRSRFPSCGIDRATAADALLATRRPLGAEPVRVSRRSRTSRASSTRSISSPRRRRSGWDVLLDAAAFVPTNRLDLAAVTAGLRRPSRSTRCSAIRPASAACSCATRRARARCAGRGSPAARSISRPCRAARTSCRRGEAGFEDGTLNYLSIPAVEIGLRHLERDRHRRRSTRACAASPAGCCSELLALRHSNGRPMVRIYGPIDDRACAAAP